MKPKGWGSRAVVVCGVTAIIAGLALGILQLSLPDMRGDEFERLVLELQAAAQETGSYQQASEQFHALRAAHENGKELMADLAGGLLVSGAILSILGERLPVSRGLRHALLRTHSIWTVGLLALLVTCLFAAGAVMQVFAAVNRFEVPPWADSVGIPVGAISAATPVLFALILAIAGAPHIRRRPRGASLGALPRLNMASIAALIVYGLLALLLVCVALLSLAQPAAWLIAPTMLVAAWLMLHARAVASA